MSAGSDPITGAVAGEIAAEERRLDIFQRAHAAIQGIDAMTPPHDVGDLREMVAARAAYHEQLAQQWAAVGAILGEIDDPPSAPATPDASSKLGPASNGTSKKAPVRTAGRRTSSSTRGARRKPKVSGASNGSSNGAGTTTLAAADAAVVRASGDVMLAAAEALTPAPGHNGWKPSDVVAIIQVMQPGVEYRTAELLKLANMKTMPSGLLRSLSSNDIVVASGNTNGRRYRLGSKALA